jgi:hypothetical protein
MTVATDGDHLGDLNTVIREFPAEGGEVELEFSRKKGLILADLTIGANVAAAVPLRANENLSNRGMMLFGSGFIVKPEEAQSLGLGRVEGIEAVIKQYRNGRDLTSVPRVVMVIDLFGFTAEEVLEQFPEIYQWVYERVKSERDHNRDKKIREDWWLHGRPRPELRDALNGLQRYVATVETSKHRFFVFLDKTILPDNKLINIALDDAYFLGVLSNKIHIIWSLATGSRLEDRPVYVKTACFEKFPFPDPTNNQKDRIRDLAEQLDAHRKRQQAQHPALTMTNM